MGNVFSRRMNTNSERNHQNKNHDSKEHNKGTRKDKRKRNDSRRNIKISNHVEIRNFKISIVNNGGRGSKQSKHSKIDEDGKVKRKDIFTEGYTSQSAKGREKLAIESVATGNFIDVRDAELKEYMYVHKDLGKWSDSVCQIRFPSGSGTGFRVGSKYIMTALHVVKEILDSVYKRIEFEIGDQNYINALQDNNVYCIFAHLKKFDPDNERRYFFKAVVHFQNEETDTAVLELVEHSDRNPFPPAFEYFGFPNLRGNFHLSGHEGDIMKTNKVDKIIDRSHPKTREDIEWVTTFSATKTDQSYEYPPHMVLSNANRILFHCKFKKGASGSPGIIVMEDGSVVVVTMLLCGYPNWRYDENVDDQLRESWPKEYCIEQGADMMKIGTFMYDENEQLYQDIFCRQLPRPSLN